MLNLCRFLSVLLFFNDCRSCSYLYRSGGDLSGGRVRLLLLLSHGDQALAFSLQGGNHFFDLSALLVQDDFVSSLNGDALQLCVLGEQCWAVNVFPLFLSLAQLFGAALSFDASGFTCGCSFFSFNASSFGTLSFCSEGLCTVFSFLGFAVSGLSVGFTACLLVDGVFIHQQFSCAGAAVAVKLCGNIGAVLSYLVALFASFHSFVSKSGRFCFTFSEGLVSLS